MSLENVQKHVTDIQTSLYHLTGEVQKLRDENAKLRGRNDNRKKLTESEVKRIRTLYGTTSLNQKAIADTFDVNPATVSRILRGKYHAKA